MLCRLCGAQVEPLASAPVLGRFNVQYFVCPVCTFVQTEEPYWLSEAYSEGIARTDIGLVGRNLRMSRVAAAVISVFFRSDAQFLDYGGGTGMFVRLMRDYGFDFYWSDRHTLNQFAVGFEDIPGHSYELVTAFEVLEHLVDPVTTLQEVLRRSDAVLFSTQLVPASRPSPEDWWYYTLDTGQHISLYSRQSLVLLSERLGVHFYTNGMSVHLFTRRRLPGILFAPVALHPIASGLLPLLLLGRKSLLAQDYFHITGKRLG